MWILFHFACEGRRTFSDQKFVARGIAKCCRMFGRPQPRNLQACGLRTADAQNAEKPKEANGKVAKQSSRLALQILTTSRQIPTKPLSISVALICSRTNYRRLN